LDVILSGKIPPNPSELLGSKKMQEVLEMLKTRYDYILIDTPPVNVVSDALELSKLLSGVILVVRSGISKKEPVKRAIERLRFVDANILGFILNAVPNTKSGCYESYYSYAGYDGNPPHSK
jgi:succinoglycan biosynthesis transport protein ExoP